MNIQFKLKFLAGLLLASTINPQLSTALAQGTAFTYEGRLNDGTNPANGSYDLKFTLFGASSGGSAVAEPLTNNATGVSNGLFTVKLEFGNAFDGSDRWLEIAVRTNGNSSFAILSPRQQLTPTPYAVYSGNAAQLGGQASTAFAPVSGSSTYVAKAGDTMTGTLNISAANGLTVGGNQLVASGGNVGIGTMFPSDTLDVSGGFRVHGSTTASSGVGVEIDDNVIGPRIFAVNRDTSEYLDLGVGDFTHGNGVLVQANGNIGIGTASSSAKLQVSTGSRTVTLDRAIPGISPGGMISFTRPDDGRESYYVGGSAAPNDDLVIYGSSGGSQVRFVSGGGSSDGFGFYLNMDQTSAFSSTRPTPVVKIDGSGNLGIGTTTPGAKLDVADTQSSVRILSTANKPLGSVLELRNNTTGLDTTLGSINFVSGTAAVQGRISCAVDGGLNLWTGGSGIVSVPILQINGADVAEPFELSSKGIPKGSLVIIDEENPGMLKASARAYDKRVAGILSGANGINSGILLKQEGFNDGGENVALSGRVYALADAANGAIHPGDLLTTSDTLGHCMKVTDHALAQGAIIGKAMSALPEGKGMVLVLVTLQ